MATTTPPTTLGILGSMQLTQVAVEVLKSDDGTNLQLSASQVVAEVLTQKDDAEVRLKASQVVIQVLREAPPYDTTPAPTTEPPSTLPPTTASPTTAAPTPAPTTLAPTASPTTTAPTTTVTTSGPQWTGPPITFAPFTVSAVTRDPDIVQDTDSTTNYPQQIIPTSCELWSGGVDIAQLFIEMPSAITTFIQVSQFGMEMMVGRLEPLPSGDFNPPAIPGTAAPYPYDSIGFIPDDI